LLFFERRASAAGEPDSIGGAIFERGRQFLPPPADGVDVQPGDAGDGPVPAVAELGGFDGGVPAALLLIEPTEQQVHLPVESLIGVRHGAEAIRAPALMDFLLRHRLTLPDRLVYSVKSLPRSVELVPGWPLSPDDAAAWFAHCGYTVKP
jgi:hypothetical protein